MATPCSLLVVSSQRPLPNRASHSSPSLFVSSVDRVFLHRALGCACARNVTWHIHPLRNQCGSHVLHEHCLNHADAPPVLTLSMRLVDIAMVSSKRRCLYALVILVLLFLVVFVVVRVLLVRHCVT